MLVYNYDSLGVYCGSSNAQKDIIRTRVTGSDAFLIPANATTIAPPATGANQVPVFSNGAWSVVADYRGQTVYNDTSSMEVEDLGEIPAGYSLTKPQAYLDMEAYEAFKGNREFQVSQIEVTVNGNTFDGDEISQGRMSRAIIAAEAANSTTIPLWVMADNTVVNDLPVADMKQALLLAMQEQAAIWVYVA